MNERELMLLTRLVEALEGVYGELHIMNDEGVVVFMGSDHLEN